jgi:hypothetical protein
MQMLTGYWHGQPEVQKLHDEFIENTISNFYMPFGVAPNFLINQKMYAIPMAIEESSVVAAASKSANFWLDRGGFKSEVIGMVKVGHVHFLWEGNEIEWMFDLFESHKNLFFDHTNDITKNMRLRGGGILDLNLIDKTEFEPGYFQIEVMKHANIKNFLQQPFIFNLLKTQTNNTHNPPLILKYAEYGHAIFFKTSAYREAGGENENFISWGPEDQERFYRFKRLNYRLSWTSNKIYHFEKIFQMEQMELLQVVCIH